MTVTRRVPSPFVLLIALVIAACSERPVQAPAGAPSLAGQITAVDRAGDRAGTVWVDAVPAVASGVPRAAVRVEQDTDIIAGTTRTDFAALTLGQYVRVWFRGPVQESDPVRATAAAIAIDSTSEGPP